MAQIFNEFLKNILTNENQRERLGIYLKKLDEYICLMANNSKTTSDLPSSFLLNNDLVKLLEAILLMVTNFDTNESSELDVDNSRIDKLILIQTFVQRITYNMKNHVDKSNLKLLLYSFD